MEFEITDNDEAEAQIESIIADLQRITKIQYKVENLRDIKITINELITYYQRRE